MSVQELIQTIEGNFQQYHQLFSRFADSDPSFSRGTNKIQELLYTLTNIQEEVVDYRLKKILKEEHPYIPQIRLDEIRMSTHLRHNPSLAEIVHHFLKQRQDLLRLLNSLPAENWERTGVHELEGHITFKEFVRRMAEKDRQIISKLRQVLVPQQSI